MDVAKYILTVLFLSSMIDDMSKPWIIFAVALSFISCIIMGFILLRDSNISDKKKNKKRR